MQTIIEWLEALGLPEYGKVFAQDDIDLAVLPDLSEGDLEKLGVTLRHRKKLLRGIEALRAAATTTSPDPPTPKPTVPIAPDAERRQVTVMFCDLVGSTALSARLDPEDLRELMGAYHQCVAEAVRRFDGLVARYMGDGALVCFGFPRAHEDDAERAVRAGLAVVDAVRAIAAAEPLEVRIGLATGLVVIGELIGAGEAQELEIVREAPNLAVRLQLLAHPGSIVLPAATRRLLGNRFTLRNLGPR